MNKTQVINVHWTAKPRGKFSNSFKTNGIRSFLGNASINIPKFETEVERTLCLKYPELFPDGAEVHVNLIDRNHI